MRMIYTREGPVDQKDFILPELEKTTCPKKNTGRLSPNSPGDTKLLVGFNSQPVTLMVLKLHCFQHTS